MCLRGGLVLGGVLAGPGLGNGMGVVVYHYLEGALSPCCLIDKELRLMKLSRYIDVLPTSTLRYCVSRAFTDI